MAVIAIDFDGTCVKEAFPLVGETVPNSVNVMKRLLERGHDLILWTVRGNYITPELLPYSSNLLRDAISWFTTNDLTLHGVNHNPDQFKNDSPKILYDLLIDDRSLGIPLSSDNNGKKFVDWFEVEKMLTRQGII